MTIVHFFRSGPLRPLLVHASLTLPAPLATLASSLSHEGRGSHRVLPSSPSVVCPSPLVGEGRAGLVRDAWG
jgi:hypothetical protein